MFFSGHMSKVYGDIHIKRLSQVEYCHQEYRPRVLDSSHELVIIKKRFKQKIKQSVQATGESRLNGTHGYQRKL